MIDIANALTTGATVAGALRAVAALEGFFARRNGNGKTIVTPFVCRAAFTQVDHDAILLGSARIGQMADANQVGFEMLHDDLQEVKQEIRELRN